MRPFGCDRARSLSWVVPGERDMLVAAVSGPVSRFMPAPRRDDADLDNGICFCSGLPFSPLPINVGAVFLTDLGELVFVAGGVVGSGRFVAPNFSRLCRGFSAGPVDPDKTAGEGLLV